MSVDTNRDDMRADQPGERQPQSFWASPAGWVAIGFIIVAGYFLITEHAAHLFTVLPWLLIGACPLMHLFMHHGHHGGGHDHAAKSDPEDKR